MHAEFCNGIKNICFPSFQNFNSFALVAMTLVMTVFTLHAYRMQWVIIYGLIASYGVILTPKLPFFSLFYLYFK